MNNRGTPLGQLCWTTVNVLLGITEMGTEALKAAFEKRELVDAATTAALQGALDAAVRELPPLGSTLPEAARPFQAQLLAAAVEARSEVGAWPTQGSIPREQLAAQNESMERRFDVERYPGFTDFNAEAEADPTSCPPPDPGPSYSPELPSGPSVSVPSGGDESPTTSAAR